MTDDREHLFDSSEPWPDLEPDDMYRIREWAFNEAPDWMDGLYLDTMARLDHAELGDITPEDYDRVTIEHSPDPDDPWLVHVEHDDEVTTIDFGDNWDAAWQFLDWLDAQWDIDHEREVEY